MSFTSLNLFLLALLFTTGKLAGMSQKNDPGFVNFGDNEGYTALHLAAQNGHAEVVEQLINYEGVIVNPQTKMHQHTPLHLAISQELLQRLLCNDNNQYLKVVEIFCKKSKESDDLKQKILETGTLFNESPLHRAAWGNNSKIVTALIESGANIEALNHSGETPLHRAALRGGKEIVENLLARGAQVNALTTVVKVAPLHYAAKYNNNDIVTLLINKGANVNITNYNGNTPLHEVADADNVYADQSGFDIVAKNLIDHGANKHAKNKDGKTPLDLAKEKRREEIIKILE